MRVTPEMVHAGALALCRGRCSGGPCQPCLDDATSVIDAVARVRRDRRDRVVPFDIEDAGFETPCWIWKKGLSKDGYADTTVGGRTKAHRWYYEQHIGSVPDGLVLDHLCRNRACVNPAHLEPVSVAENRRRGDGVKLTMELAREIRAAGGSQYEIADRYGVSQSSVSQIKRGLTWKEASDGRSV